MRFITVLAVILLTACATSVAQNRNIPISVIGEGPTLADAKNNGFQKAIEQEVGLILLSHKEVNGNKLSKDEIILHSSGYVNDYTINKTKVIDGTYYISMDVYVKSSTISERVLGVYNNEPSNFDGEKLNDLIVSNANNKKTGDDVLISVLSDYPQYAFVIDTPSIKKQGVQVWTDINNNIVFIIPTKINYNYKFVKSLNEALKITSDTKIPNHKTQQEIIVKSIEPGSFRDLIGYSKTDRYYINDINRANLIKQYFDTDVYLKIDALDINGKKLFHVCDEITSRNLSIYDIKSFEFYGSVEYKGNVEVKLPSTDPKIKHINSFVQTIHKGKC